MPVVLLQFNAMRQMHVRAVIYGKSVSMHFNALNGTVGLISPEPRVTT